MSNLTIRQTCELISFDEAKLKLIRNVLAKDLTDLEFDLYISVAKARGLDPVLRQIHAVKRSPGGGKPAVMTIQVGIDGFRLIAARTGDYAGCDESVFTYDADGFLQRCKITIYKMVQGQRCAFTATARWDEYFPGDHLGFMWKKMPETMLSKVCEALALRKAFPADLSGLYVDEEMEQANKSDASRDVSPAAEPAPEPPKIVKPKLPSVEVVKITKAFAALNVSKLDIQNFFDIDNLEDLTEPMMAELRSKYDHLKAKMVTRDEAFGLGPQPVRRTK